jgi:hypothetical protein
MELENYLKAEGIIHLPDIPYDCRNTDGHGERADNGGDRGSEVSIIITNDLGFDQKRITKILKNENSIYLNRQNNGICNGFQIRKG